MTDPRAEKLAAHDGRGQPPGWYMDFIEQFEAAGLLVVADDEYTVGKIVCVLGAYVWSSSQRERAKAILEALRSNPPEGFCSCPPIGDGQTTFALDCGISGHRSNAALPPADPAAAGTPKDSAE